MAVRDPCQILERAATEGGTEQTEEQTSARSVVALVTGATGKGGIGYETARQLAKKLTRKGVHIVLAGSKELGEEVCSIMAYTVVYCACAHLGLGNLQERELRTRTK